MADISQITLPNGQTYDIKDPVARAAAGDAGAGKIFYGVCSTGASTQTKVVTIDDFELFAGALVAVKFENVNTATSPMLNISGTGAVNMYSVGTTAVLPNAWSAGETLLFVYNGTSFMVADGGIASTSGYGATKLNSSTSSTSTTEAATPSAVKSAYDLALEAKTSASDGKSLIASAITGKGVSTSATDTFATMASNIDAIETGIEITNGKIEQYKAEDVTIPANTFVEIKSDLNESFVTSNTVITSSSNGGYYLATPIGIDSAIFSFYTGSSSSNRTAYIRKFKNGSYSSTLSITTSGYNSRPTIMVENSVIFVFCEKYSYSVGTHIRVYDQNSNTLGAICALGDTYKYGLGIRYIGNNRYVFICSDNKSTTGYVNREINIFLLEHDVSNNSLSVISSSTCTTASAYGTELSNQLAYVFSEVLQDGSVLFTISHYVISGTNNYVRCALLINVGTDNTIAYKLYDYTGGTPYLLCPLGNGNYVRIADSYCYLHTYSGTFSGGYTQTSSTSYSLSFLDTLYNSNNRRHFVRISDNRFVSIIMNPSSYALTYYVYELNYVPTLVATYTTSLPTSFNINYIHLYDAASVMENHITYPYSTGAVGYTSYPVVFDVNAGFGIIYPLSKIDGITIDEITTTTEGDVWVLDSN